LSLVFLLEFALLFYQALQGHQFLMQALAFLVLGVAAGFVALYYHGRFRSRN
jgi:hypothetical protein